MIELLTALGVSNNYAELYGPILEQACPQWDIDEPREIAAFVANCAHESARFSQVRENLNYSAEALCRLWPKRVSPQLAQQIARKPQQIANVVYANRMGNGDIASGDGWRFAGKGLIQVTGRSNYERLSYAWGVDCIEHPDLLTEPNGAVVSACWFWKTNGCNELAQQGRWKDLCLRINGGLNGLEERVALTNAALQFLGVTNDE